MLHHLGGATIQVANLANYTVNLDIFTKFRENQTHGIGDITLSFTEIGK